MNSNNFMGRIFGWKFKKDEESDSIQKVDSGVIAPYDDDANFITSSTETAFGGRYAQILDIDGNFKDDNDLIKRYRAMALLPEVDNAITDIVNEAIVTDSDHPPVSLNLDNLKWSKNRKDAVTKEFDKILKLLNFNVKASDYFRKWYVDGRIYFYLIIDQKNPSNGIKEIRYVSALELKKIKENIETLNPQGIIITNSTEEYFIYQKSVSSQKNKGRDGLTTQSIKLPGDCVSYATSGIVDETTNTIFSYLHKSMRLANQLKMIEDAIVVYRIARAPERRVFYVDVGNLKTGKAEEYLRGIMNKFKNKMVYDSENGEVKDAKHTQSMIEDFWLPRREGSQATSIQTLSGGQNLGQIEDIEFFQKKLYQSLSVPINRLTGENNAFTIGKAADISREEIKFSKFISRLRKKFAMLFFDLLKKQLILKGIISTSEWTEISENINIDYTSDTMFAELKEAEILRERVATFRDVEPLIGTYYSKRYAMKNILHMTDEEIEMNQKEIEDEKVLEDPEDGQGNENDSDENDDSTTNQDSLGEFEIVRKDNSKQKNTK